MGLERDSLLDASLHLYIRVHPSVGLSSSPSFGPSDGPSDGPQPGLLNIENELAT